MSGRYGYAGTILRVDLTSGSITSAPTVHYAGRFLGGRGVGTSIYWDEVSPGVGALDPDNRLIFVTGPLTGIPPAGSRWQIIGKSPALVPDGFCYTNLGGNWGACLKKAGFDGVIVQGKSDRPAYVFIHDGVAEIRDASALWGKGSIEVRDFLKQELGSQASVVATGPAGENLVTFASLLADGDASGSCGFGAVMGSKKLKAIAVTGNGKLPPADRDELRELTRYVRRLLGNTPRLDPILELPPDTKHDVCFACIGCDMRSSYQAEDGTKGKYACGSGAFYQEPARRYYGRWTEVPFLANRLCDQYGLDIYPLVTTMMWMSRCASAGILTEENTGLPLSKTGSLEFIEALVRKISFREGFGDILARGPVRAASALGEPAESLIRGLVSDAVGHVVTLDPRLLLYTGLVYAMEPRLSTGQVSEIIGRGGGLWSHWADNQPGAYLSGEVMRSIARTFWGGELAVDFSTYDGKALAAKRVQDRQFANDCLILCLWMFPITDSEFTEDHVGDPTIESRILSAVTSTQTGEHDLYRMGERVFNLQRAVLAREGRRGRESDSLPDFFFTQPLKHDFTVPGCLVPGKDGRVISRKGQVFDRMQFEKMKDEFYLLRGWDVATGLQTRAKLEELGLHDVATALEPDGLVL